MERGTQKLRTFDIRDLAADNMSGLCVKSLHADGLGEGKVPLRSGGLKVIPCGPFLEAFRLAALGVRRG